MVKTESCALCFTTKSKWFLDIYCEENQSMDISAIISKHLWFELKPSGQCYVCADCWKNVYDFHLFYCKLEKLHLETNEPDSRTVQIDVQPDFEFHPIDEVKVEPLDEDDQNRSTDGVADSSIIGFIGKQTTEVSSSEAVRPKRNTSTPVCQYKAEITESDAEDIDGDCFADDFDDDNDLDYKTEPKEGKLKAVEIPKIKKRRGRPPKAIAVKKETDLDTSNETEQGESSKDSELRHKVKKRRKFKKRLTRNKYDSDTGSNDGDRSRIGSKRARDERLFKYIEEFVCHLCPERVEFDRFHHANLHYREFHQEPAYLKCTKCDRKCFTPGGFINHMETHDDPDKNKCKICGKVTDQKITLKKHMRAHRLQMEESLPFPCAICPRRFELERARDKHERLHGRKIVIKREKGRDDELIAFYKKISCEICDEEKNDGVTYENFWDLKLHMAGEHNKTPYLKCPICFKKNVCRQQLMIHVDVHENPERYRCDICGEVFQFLEKHKFKAHGQTEPQEKNYSCEHCGKMFRCVLNLRNHIDRVHAIKDVTCDICNKPFSKKAISAHKRSAHTDEMFMCEQCPKMFKTRSGLESHKSEHDAELRKPVKCEICGKEMRRGASLTKHMKVIHSKEAPVNCNMCGKEFRTKFHMVRHRTNTCSATINSRPFKCEVCGKGFSMRLTMTEHMTTHTRTSLYQCAFCFKTFGYISNLYKHRKKAHPEEWQEVQSRPDQGIATVIEIRN
ncbi:zinc finger protein 678-like [Wyeomyia smithii]|uniref:zinc finger protein 678-like n=1 Tax=Wyeomyia smithii TaxID=174621 RepID=UPI0024681EC1|nr:zinc finger protein 678-like [Wyeomyia smithii]